MKLKGREKTDDPSRDKTSSLDQTLMLPEVKAGPGIEPMTNMLD
jgi:hypothetical protein